MGYFARERSRGQCGKDLVGHYPMRKFPRLSEEEEGGTTVRAYVAEVRMYNVAGGWPATRRWGWCRAWRLLQYILRIGHERRGTGVAFARRGSRSLHVICTGPHLDARAGHRSSSAWAAQGRVTCKSRDRSPQRPNIHSSAGPPHRLKMSRPCVIAST